MKYKIYLILFVTNLISQIEIKDLTNTNNFKDLKIKKTIQNDFDFYQAVYVDKIKENYVIVDLGNNTIYIFDQKLQKIKQFSEEGEGPGRIQFISYLYIIDDKYILVGNALKLSIFNDKGEFINQINLLTYKNPEIISLDRTFLLKSQGEKLEYYLMTSKGVLNSKIITDKSNYKRYNHKLIKGYSGSYYYNRPFYFNNSFIDVRVHKKFTITQFDLTFNEINNYSYNFKAIKRNWDSFFRYKTIVKDDKVETIKIYGKTAENLADYGDFRKDIKRIIDVTRDNVYLEIANAEIGITKIIKLNSEFNIIEKYQFKAKHVIDMRIKGNELITSQKDDEQGPFITIYQLNE